jgi:hypothetical protein
LKHLPFILLNDVTLLKHLPFMLLNDVTLYGTRFLKIHSFVLTIRVKKVSKNDVAEVWLWPGIDWADQLET